MTHAKCNDQKVLSFGTGGRQGTKEATKVHTEVVIKTVHVLSSISNEQVRRCTYQPPLTHIIYRDGPVWIFQFPFDSVFNLKYSVSGFFSFSVFAHHRNARVS